MHTKIHLAIALSPLWPTARCCIAGRVFKHCQDREAELDAMEDDEIDRVCMEGCRVERVEPPPGVEFRKGMVSSVCLRLWSI